MSTVTVDGIEMSVDAAENAYECAVDVRADLRDLMLGRRTAADLLTECLEGADADREQGWREYVEALVEHMERGAEGCARAHLRAIGWRPEHGRTDAALGIGEEAWGGAGSGRQWTVMCENAVRRLAAQAVTP